VARIAALTDRFDQPGGLAFKKKEKNKPGGFWGTGEELLQSAAGE
jgi:hypothetical protein